MKIVIIANPIAGRGRAYKTLQRLVERWPHGDWEVEFLTTRGPEDAGTLAVRQLSGPPDLLAVCGGDGTMNEVVSRLPEPDFPVAVLPAGTANVLARNLGLSLNPVRALEVALRRTVRRVDLGRIRSGTPRAFLLMTGIGFDAHVVATVGTAAKKWLGVAAYAVAILRALASYSFPEFQVSIGDEDLTATSCLIANSSGYGGGLVFTPSAEMLDGVLDVLVLQGRPQFGYIKFILQACLRKPCAYPWIRRIRAADVKVRGPKEIWVHADGELAGSLPIDVSVSPRTFPLVVPG